MMASGAVDVKLLISHRYELDNALNAYALLAGGEPSLGILLEYPQPADALDELHSRTIELKADANSRHQQFKVNSVPTVAFIGAGNYAGQVLIPAFKEAGAVLNTVASSAGVSGVHFGKKHGFNKTTTDALSVFSDDDVNTIVVATRHDSHADFVLQALKAGKHVFVEKPLCLTMEELDEIKNAMSVKADAEEKLPLLMVGFNRRFAPQIQKMKQLLEGVSESKSFVMTVNAGEIPADHWTQDSQVGGGRIIGEACHFIDLLRFLADAAVTDYQATFMGQQSGMRMTSDKVSISLSFADGSMGTIHYLANGHKSFPKERLEVFCAGRVLQLDNFRKLKAYGWPGFNKMNIGRQDKGQKACAAAFLQAIRKGQPAPIPVDEIFEVSRLSIEIAGNQ